MFRIALYRQCSKSGGTKQNQPGNPRFREPELILREFISNYYGAITNIDYNMGRIMAGLKNTV